MTIMEFETILNSPYFFVVIYILIAIVLSFLVKQLSIQVLEQFVKHNPKIKPNDYEKYVDTLSGLTSTIAYVIIWVTMAAFILRTLRINISGMLAGAGVFGAALALVAQDTIRDIMAGLFIITENQYRVGDIIALRVGTHVIKGSVESLTLRVTKLRDLDGKLHIIRNNIPTAITNSTLGHANVNLDIIVPYDSDIEQIEQLVNQIGDNMATKSPWKNAIIEPIHFLRIDDFSTDGVVVKVFGRVLPAMQWDVAGEFRRCLKREFEANNIKFSTESSD